MTIAAGFVCSDGIVVCADTEYSNTYTKVHRTKIWHSPNNDCLIVAAGDEVLMNEVATTLLARFDSGMDRAELKGQFEKTLEAVHKQYIEKEAYDPNYNVVLLVAANASDGSVLYRHSKWAATAVTSFACIGSGESFGNYVADRLWQASGTLISACVVAAHLLQLAKRYVPGCGGAMSEIYVLPPNGPAYPQSARNLRNLEQLFDGVDAVLRPLLIAIPDSQISDAVIEEKLQRFCEGVRATRPFPFDVTVTVTGVAAGTSVASAVGDATHSQTNDPDDGALPEQGD